MRGRNEATSLRGAPATPGLAESRHHRRHESRGGQRAELKRDALKRGLNSGPNYGDTPVAHLVRPHVQPLLSNETCRRKPPNVQNQFELLLTATSPVAYWLPFLPKPTPRAPALRE